MRVHGLRMSLLLPVIPCSRRQVRGLGQFLCGVVLCWISLGLQAQSTFDGYTHRIRLATSIAKFGPGLFGDSTNMLDGSTTFSVTDVSVPTNGMVPLSVGRTYRVDDQPSDQQGRTRGSGVFGPYWDLDIPYMVGTFDAQRGWVGSASQIGVNTQSDFVKRCTLGGNGPAGTFGVGQFNSVFYQPPSFFSGININIPGSGMEEMLYLTSGLYSSQTAGNFTYYFKTKNNWLVGCTSSIQNASTGTPTSGEGFNVRLPDGRTYTFGWMVTVPTSYINDDSCGTAPDIFPSTEVAEYVTSCISGVSIPRSRVYLFATQATDRFGNTVTYTYDPANPSHLQSIKSSDGGLITLTYGSNGNVSSISSGSRTWQYNYNANAQLASVTLPDGSQWAYDYGQNTVGIDVYRSKDIWWDCLLNIGTETTDVAPGTNDSNTVTITSPSGAKGVFVFRKILHGTRQAESQCQLAKLSASAPGPVPHMSGPTSDYQTASLVQKTLTIPGASTMQWTYAYHPGWVAPYQAVTTVTDSMNRVRTFTYGTDSTINYGQLLQETVATTSGAILRTITYHYLGGSTLTAPSTQQNFPELPGDPLNINLGWESGFHIRNRPVYSTTITQQGKTFTRTVDSGCPSAGVYCFDNFVRPTRVIMSSQ